MRDGRQSRRGCGTIKCGPCAARGLSVTGLMAHSKPPPIPGCLPGTVCSGGGGKEMNTNRLVKEMWKDASAKTSTAAEKRRKGKGLRCGGNVSAETAGRWRPTRGRADRVSACARHGGAPRQAGGGKVMRRVRPAQNNGKVDGAGAFSPARAPFTSGLCVGLGSRLETERDETAEHAQQQGLADSAMRSSASLPAQRRRCLPISHAISRQTAMIC